MKSAAPSCQLPPKPVASIQADHRNSATRVHGRSLTDRLPRAVSERGISSRAAQRAAVSPVVSPGPPSTLLTDSSLIQHRAQPPETTARPQQLMRVAIDVDEGLVDRAYSTGVSVSLATRLLMTSAPAVLARFLPSLNRFVREKYGIVYAISDYSVYEFHKIWRCDSDTARNIVHDFFNSRHFTHGIRPIPGAYQSLQRLRPYCDLVVVTSRQNAIQDDTRSWLNQHFPDTFQEVYFGNHFAMEGAMRSKSEICREVGAVVLVDDNPGYAVDCASSGLQVLLYDWQLSYPWNRPCPASPADHDTPNVVASRDFWRFSERCMPALICTIFIRLEHPLIRRVKDWNQVEAALRQLSLQQS